MTCCEFATNPEKRFSSSDGKIGYAWTGLIAVDLAMIAALRPAQVLGATEIQLPGQALWITINVDYGTVVRAWENAKRGTRWGSEIDKYRRDDR